MGTAARRSAVFFCLALIYVSLVPSVAAQATHTFGAIKGAADAGTDLVITFSPADKHDEGGCSSSHGSMGKGKGWLLPFLLHKGFLSFSEGSACKPAASSPAPPSSPEPPRSTSPVPQVSPSPPANPPASPSPQPPTNPPHADPSPPPVKPPSPSPAAPPQDESPSPAPPLPTLPSPSPAVPLPSPSPPVPSPTGSSPSPPAMLPSPSPAAPPPSTLPPNSPPPPLPPNHSDIPPILGKPKLPRSPAPPRRSPFPFPSPSPSHPHGDPPPKHLHSPSPSPHVPPPPETSPSVPACAASQCPQAAPCEAQPVCVLTPPTCPAGARCRPLASSSPYTCVYKFKPPSSVCHKAAGPCGQDVKCSGVSGQCPSDKDWSLVHQPAGRQCAVAGGNCGSASFCLGNSTLCPQPRTHGSTCFTYRCGKKNFYSHGAKKGSFKKHHSGKGWDIGGLQLGVGDESFEELDAAAVASAPYVELEHWGKKGGKRRHPCQCTPGWCPNKQQPFDAVFMVCICNAHECNWQHYDYIPQPPKQGASMCPHTSFYSKLD